MNTITCQSCGMQYDGSGLQPGVQFQCTQCGSMVAVSAPAPMARKAGPRGPAARGGKPAGPSQGVYAPLPPKNSGGTGKTIAIVVVALVLILVVSGVIIGVSSSQSRVADLKKEREDADAALKAKVLKENEENRRKNEAQAKPMNASMSAGDTILTALQTASRTKLESMFDWGLYARYNQELIAGDPKHLNSPLIADGEWAKDDKGLYTGVWVGRASRTAESLKQRVMGYLQEFAFHAEGIEWRKEKTEKGSFSHVLGDEKYYGYKIFIDVPNAGTSKEFWVGALYDSNDAKILNFVAPGVTEQLRDLEAANPKGDNREWVRDDRDPKKPSDLSEDDPRNDPDFRLPQVAKTGATPTLPHLRNAVTELASGGTLNQQRLKQLRGESNKNEKKAAMGAFIDLLIDAHKASDRSKKYNISRALYDVFDFVVYTNWDKSKMVYEIKFEGQATDDMVVRRWLELYVNVYLVDEKAETPDKPE